MDDNFRSAINIISDVDLGFKFEAKDEDYKSSPILVTDSSITKKRGRPSKTNREDIVTSTGKESKSNTVNSLPVSYKEEYAETDNMLRGAINQIDNFTSNIENDLAIVRNKNNLAKKYDYISALVGAEGSLVGNKVSAIREMNNSINKANDMEFKRIKELRIGEEGLDDNKIIMDLYANMVRNPGSMPMLNQDLNTYTATIPNNSIISNASNMISGISSVDTGYNDYINNLSPEQNLMLMENNPNIEEVVCYNQDTGAAFFDVYDMSTNMPVLNVPKKDQVWMENTIIDLQEGVARNNKLGEVYKVILIGNTKIDNDMILSQY